MAETTTPTTTTTEVNRLLKSSQIVKRSFARGWDIIHVHIKSIKIVITNVVKTVK